MTMKGVSQNNCIVQLEKRGSLPFCAYFNDPFRECYAVLAERNYFVIGYSVFGHKVYRNYNPYKVEKSPILLWFFREVKGAEIHSHFSVHQMFLLAEGIGSSSIKCRCHSEYFYRILAVWQ